MAEGVAGIPAMPFPTFAHSVHNSRRYLVTICRFIRSRLQVFGGGSL
jgi:hypothetical protein